MAQRACKVGHLLHNETLQGDIAGCSTIIGHGDDAVVGLFKEVVAHLTKVGVDVCEGVCRIFAISEQLHGERWPHPPHVRRIARIGCAQVTQSDEASVAALEHASVRVVAIVHPFDLSDAALAMRCLVAAVELVTLIIKDCVQVELSEANGVQRTDSVILEDLVIDDVLLMLSI